MMVGESARSLARMQVAAMRWVESARARTGEGSTESAEARAAYRTTVEALVGLHGEDAPCAVVDAALFLGWTAAARAAGRRVDPAATRATASTGLDASAVVVGDERARCAA